MCLGGGSGGKAPVQVPVVKPPPKDTTITAAPPTSPLVKETNKNKKRVAGQQGVFGNLATSPMGDARYGGNTAAPRFGAK